MTADVIRDTAVLIVHVSTARSCLNVPRARSWLSVVSKEMQMTLKVGVQYKWLAEQQTVSFTYYNLLLGSLVMQGEMAFILWPLCLSPLLPKFITLPFLNLSLLLSCLDFQYYFSSKLLELSVEDCFTLCCLLTLHPLLSDQTIRYLFCKGSAHTLPKTHRWQELLMCFSRGVIHNAERVSRECIVL